MNYVKAKVKYQDGSLSDKAAYYEVKPDDRYGFIYQNFQGGWCLKECIEIIESGVFTGTKEQFIELYRREFYDYLIKEDSPYGWLSPFCEWFPCAYTRHQDVAVDYLGYDEEELEERGWIKVFKEYNSDDAVYAQFKANEKQLEWLGNHQVHYSKHACMQ